MKRRVNTKFLVILTVAIAGLGAALFVANKIRIRMATNPAKYVKLAEASESQGRYEDAAKNWHVAFALSRPKDLSLLMKEADAWRSLAQTEPVYAKRAFAAWNAALESDRNYVPALKEMLKAYEESLASTGNPQQRASGFRIVQEYAQRLHAADPSNKYAAAKEQIMIVQAANSGVATEPKAVDDAIAKLSKLAVEDPGNSEIPATIAGAYLKRALEAGRSGDIATFEKNRGLAAQTLDDALNRDQKGVEVRLRSAAIYMMMGGMAVHPEKGKEYATRAKAELAKAREMIKPEDPKYVELMTQLGTFLAQSQDAAAAEEVLAEVVKQRPDDPVGRLAYARVLRMKPESRDKAIELLSAIKPSGSPKTRRYEAQALYDLGALQLERAADLGAGTSQGQAAITELEGTLDRLQQFAGDSAAVLRLRGEVALMKGREVEAIQTLVKAKAAAEQVGQPDDELLFSLARAYLAGHQTGEAKKVLGQLLVRRPDFYGGRRLLAQLLLMENDADGAEPHVAYLEKAILDKKHPDDPEVRRQRMAIYALRKQTDELAKVYESLPEGTKRERVIKSQAAMEAGKTDDAIRLLDAAWRDDVKDASVARYLINAYRAKGDVASARRVADSVAAANPGDLTMMALRQQLAGASAEEMQQATRETIEKNPDEFTRELQLAALASDENKPIEAKERLAKAEKLKPQDTRVLLLGMQVYAKEGKWAEATRYVDKLAEIDKANGPIYRVRLLVAQDKIAEASALAQEGVQKFPELTQSWLALGMAHQAANQPDQALTAYKRALEKQTDNSEAIRGLIDCSYALNQPSEAQKYIAIGRRTFPTNPSFKDMELKHVLRYGDPAQAISQFEELRKQSPESRMVAESLLQAYWRGATAKAAARDQAGANKVAEQIVALAEEGMKKWPGDQVFYAYGAQLTAMHKDLDGGVKIIRRLAATPEWKDRPEPLLMLGDYYVSFNKGAEAEAAFREAMTKGADDTAARVKLSALQASTGRIDDALKTLEPKEANAAVARQKLQILVVARRLDAGEKLATEMLEKDPKDAAALNALITIYIEGGQYAQVLKKTNEILAGNPDNVVALYGRGLALMRQEKPDYDGAIKDLTAVRAKNANNIEARYWLAEAYLAKRDTDAAIRELDAAAQLVPDNKRLRLKIVEVCSSANPPRWIDAERTLREASNQPSLANDVDLTCAAARMWINRQQPENAVDLLQKAMSQANSNAAVMQTYLTALLAAGQYPRMLAETDKMIAAAAQHQPAAAVPYWVHTGRAVAFKRLDKRDEAMSEFEKALDTPEARQDDGVAGDVLNKLAAEIGADEALARIAPRAVDGQPKAQRWQLAQAYLYNQKRDYAAAVAIVEKLMAGLDKLTPVERQNLLRFAGLMYLQIQPAPQPQKAIEAFKLSLKESPDDSSILNNIASLLTDYLSPPDPDQALTYSQRAYDLMVKSGQTEPLVLDTHGRVLTLLPNRLEEGIVLLQNAADHTDIPDPQLHLAEAYLKKGKRDEAQKHLAQAQAAVDRQRREKHPVDETVAARITKLQAETKKAVAEDPKAQAGAR